MKAKRYGIIRGISVSANTEEETDTVRFELKEHYRIDSDETNAHNSGNYEDAFGSEQYFYFCAYCL